MVGGKVCHKVKFLVRPRVERAFQHSGGKLHHKFKILVSPGIERALQHGWG